MTSTEFSRGEAFVGGCATKPGATNANSRTQASAQPGVALPREPKKGTMYRAPTKRDGEGAPTNWGKVTEKGKRTAMSGHATRTEEGHDVSCPCKEGRRRRAHKSEEVAEN